VSTSKTSYSDELRLRSGVSISQTRFALSNFCLSNLGGDGQYFADVLELCGDTARMQDVVNTIREEVRKRCPERLAALIACVREANDTAGDTTPTPTLAPAGRPVAPAAVAAAPGAAPGATAPRKPAAAAAPDPLLLKPGISLAQGRFALAEFCLNELGARGQPLTDAINGCKDVAALQHLVRRIGGDPQERGWLPKLVECVREINASSD
jgi:hypothetical protein